MIAHDIFKERFHHEPRWKEAAKKAFFAAHARPTKQIARQSMDCLDLTSLKGGEDGCDILSLCDTAKANKVAAVCVYPDMVRAAKRAFRHDKLPLVATVINFPSGSFRTQTNIPATPRTVMEDVLSAIDSGARQIDIVFPYQDFLQGREHVARPLLQTCREACDQGVVMKVIMETSAFDCPDKLAKAVDIAIRAGADCIKTSTGKHENGGASLEAAAVIMDRIKYFRAKQSREIGIKISGGISSVQACAQFITLQELNFGTGSVTPSRFRIGGSSLLNSLLDYLRFDPFVGLKA